MLQFNHSFCAPARGGFGSCLTGRPADLVLGSMDRGMLRANLPRLLLLALLGSGVVAFFLLGGPQQLSFEALKHHKDTLIQWAEGAPWLAVMLFIGAYLVLGFFGLPGGTILNLCAGLMFDFWKGMALIMVASTSASALAFVSFRYLFRDFVDSRLRQRFPKIEEGLEREGAYFVFTLRLLPAIPYSLTNLVLAVSPVHFIPYLWVTFVAMLPRYALYAYAGTKLGDVENPRDLLSWRLILVLGLLAVLPWLFKKLHDRLKRKKLRQV